MSFSIDGFVWDYPCMIEREAEMTPSEISGLMLNKSYFNDVLGTWMSYDLTLAVPFDKEDDYYTIYEQLIQPVDGHSFVFPYNAGNITITGRVSSVQDVWVRMPGNRNYWRGTRFSIKANHPTKTMSLGQVIETGRAPLPDVSSPNIGDTYTFTAGGWDVYETPPDVDNRYY